MAVMPLVLLSPSSIFPSNGSISSSGWGCCGVQGGVRDGAHAALHPVHSLDVQGHGLRASGHRASSLPAYKMALDM